MLSRIIAKLEGATGSLVQWVAGFVGILFVRFFLENFSSPTPSFPAVPDGFTVIHYALFFIGTFLSLALVLGFLTRDVLKATKFLYFGFPIIFVAPIFDFIASRGAGYRMAYVFVDNFQAFFARIYPWGVSGFFGNVTPGLGFEFTAITIGAGIYIFCKTKKIWTGILGAILAYLVLFVWCIAPSLPKLIHDLFTGRSPLLAAQFMITAFSASHVAENILRPTLTISYSYGYEMIFNVGMSSVLYLVDSILIVVWFFVWNARAVTAILKNIRIERILHLALLFIAGVFASHYLSGVVVFGSWADIIGILVLGVSYFIAWLFAVAVNDVHDIEIDSVSNKERPLVSKTLSRADMEDFAVVSFPWFLIGAFLSGYWAMFLILAFTALYYIYSAPPLRLKRVPLLSSFLISLASLSAAMAGFFFAMPSKLLSSFPMMFLVLVVVCFTLGVNVKDIKDIEGDKLDGVKTIPVIFGKKNGKMVIGALLAVGFLAVPIILQLKSLFVPSFAAAAIGYWLVVAEPFRERRIFALYFIYATIIGIMLWFH